ncbi:MAG: Gx transporter family protein, partial [Eubacterium sp.]|nr:Gx transporter family protein [Eubacterium sp.]
MTQSRESRTYRMTLTAMLTVIALMFSYIEAMIPVTLGIPGFKLGFANIMVIIALYALDARYAFSVDLV